MGKTLGKSSNPFPNPFNIKYYKYVMFKFVAKRSIQLSYKREIKLLVYYSSNLSNIQVKIKKIEVTFKVTS